MPCTIKVQGFVVYVGMYVVMLLSFCPKVQ